LFYNKYLKPTIFSKMNEKKRKASKALSQSQSIKKKVRSDSDDEDATRDMVDPPSVPNVEEVDVPKLMYSKKDIETQPIKGGILQEIGEKDENIVTIQKETTAEESLTEQTHHIIVPSYASWFNYNEIHSIEKRGLPEFFNGKNASKTDEIYFTYRNFMIDTYRLNPMEYMTATGARRNLAGDVCAIMRVHAFLEQWGLINYQVDPDAKPRQMGPPPTSHFHVLADTPTGLQPIATAKPANVNSSAANNLVDFDKEKTELKTPVTNAPLTNFGLNSDVYTAHLKAQQPKGKTAAAAAVAKPWTNKEILLLLESLEMYKDDWNKVSEHVGSRSQSECILQFLRLPILDPYVDGSAIEKNGIDVGYSQQLPFSKQGNPVMSTVAFLASVVSPQVASAAAKAAIDEFTKLNEKPPQHVVDAHIKAVEEQAKLGNIDPSYGIDKSNIAGCDKKVEKESETPSKNENKTSDAQESEKMEVDSATNTIEVKKDCSKKVESEENSKDEEKNQEKKDAEKELERDIPKGTLKTAAASALGAAAVKAKYMAYIEERRIKSLVAQLVETQMKKLEIKLRHFEELETIMERERDQLEIQRQQLVSDRQKFMHEQIQLQGLRMKSSQPKVVTQVSTTNNGPSAPSSSQFVAQQPLHSQAPEQQQVKPTMQPENQQQLYQQQANHSQQPQEVQQANGSTAIASNPGQPLSQNYNQQPPSGVEVVGQPMHQ